jgi:hypothetical protein
MLFSILKNKLNIPALFLFLGFIAAMTELLSAVPEVDAGFYFSNTYQEARRKFLAAATAADGSIEYHTNPHLGAEGEALYTDVVSFNLPEAKTILVLGSGTHGVEGFAGSAIQVGLLQNGISEALPDEVGLLFYHALNPYGFSHLRRFNEDNIDLNRNFVAHKRHLYSNENYDKLAWLFEPESLSAWENLKARIGVAWYRITKGVDWLQSAISGGQYNHPQGVFYGGSFEVWSNRTLQVIVKKHLSMASRVILIDFHTGLGEYGAAEVITQIKPDTPMYIWIQNCWEAPITNPNVGDAVSSPIRGSLKLGFEKLLPNAEVIAVSLEFGTYPLSKVLWALRAENYLQHNADREHPDNQVTKNELKRVFYPQKEDWMRSVWYQGSRMVLNTLNCLR